MNVTDVNKCKWGEKCQVSTQKHTGTGKQYVLSDSLRVEYQKKRIEFCLPILVYLEEGAKIVGNVSYHFKNDMRTVKQENKQQGGAELCQAQYKLELVKFWFGIKNWLTLAL